jgi:hypothetical protein
MKRTSALLIASLMLAGCGKPHVTFLPQKTQSGLEFHLNLKNVNGLLRTTFWEGENQKTLWDVNLNYFPGPILKYGELPADFTTFNGDTDSARQDHPKTLGALPIPAETIVYVQVGYQYDEFISACASDKIYAFQLTKDGSVINMGEQVRLPEGQYADIWKRPQQNPGGDSQRAAPQE